MKRLVHHWVPLSPSASGGLGLVSLTFHKVSREGHCLVSSQTTSIVRLHITILLYKYKHKMVNWSLLLELQNLRHRVLEDLLYSFSLCFLLSLQRVASLMGSSTGKARLWQLESKQHCQEGLRSPSMPLKMPWLVTVKR